VAHLRHGPSELGVQPTDAGAEHHEISPVCDDVEQKVVELAAEGARFAGNIEGRGSGRSIAIEVPDVGKMLLYEARHPTAFDL